MYELLSICVYFRTMHVIGMYQLVVVQQTGPKTPSLESRLTLAMTLGQKNNDSCPWLALNIQCFTETSQRSIKQQPVLHSGWAQTFLARQQRLSSPVWQTLRWRSHHKLTSQNWSDWPDPQGPLLCKVCACWLRLAGHAGMWQRCHQWHQTKSINDGNWEVSHKTREYLKIMCKSAAKFDSLKCL